MAFDQAPYHELFTSDRTNGTTVLDSDGVLKEALRNELTSTNLSDTDYWSHGGLDSLIASGVSPSGKTAYLMTEDSGASTHYFLDGVAFTAGDYIKYSFDIKANGRTDFHLYLATAAFGANVEWSFDLTAMTATQETGGTKDAGFIASLGNDWYRIDLYAQATATTTANVIGYLSNGTSTSYTGDGSSGVYLSRPRVMKASVHAPVERTTNGEFTSDLSGWTDFSEGTGSIAWNASGYIDLTTGVDSTNEGRAYQAHATVVGETYRVEWDKVSGASRVDISSSTSGAELGSSPDTATDGMLTFVATATTTYVNLRNLTNYSATSSISKISFTKVITNGVQLDQNGEDFVETTNGAVFCSGEEFDGNGAFRGLQCFEGRTNSRTYSVDFSADTENNATATPNASVGPDGDLSMTHLVEDGTTNIHRLQLTTMTLTGANVFAVKVAKTSGRRLLINADGLMDAKGLFDLTDGSGSVVTTSGTASDLDADIVDDGDFYICYLVGTGVGTAQGSYLQLCEAGHTTTADDSYAGDSSSYIGIYGVDVQAGSSLAPYIPTNGAAASRDADSTYKALSEFGSRQDEYSVLVEFESAGSDGSDYPRVFDIDDGSGDNASRVYIDNTNTLYQSVRAGGSTVVLSNLGSATLNASSKIAAAYKADDFSASDDGDAVVADTAGAMPPVSTLRLGNTYSGSHLNGYIRKIVYQPKRLANTTLVEQSA